MKINNIKTMRASSKSNVGSLASAVVAEIQKECEINLEVIGASAVNQAMKAAAIANRVLSEQGIDISVKPSFLRTDVNGELMRGINLKICRDYSR